MLPLVLRVDDYVHNALPATQANLCCPGCVLQCVCGQNKVSKFGESYQLCNDDFVVLLQALSEFSEPCLHL